MKRTYSEYRRRFGRRVALRFVWRKIRPAVITAALIGWMYLTARLFAYGYQIRGYFAPGGEIFMPFVPALVWTFVETWRDMKALIDRDNKVKRQKG